MNLGLPRTVTLSFIRVMDKAFGVSKEASCHQLQVNWPKYAGEILAWQRSPDKVRRRLGFALKKCVAFADIL